LQQALTIVERSLGSNDSDLGVILNNLAQLSQAQGRSEEAEPLFRRALTINEKAFPPDHPDTATTLENYASLLRELNRPREAQPLEQRAKAIRARLSSKSTM
jgi:tetratricopeptide (TPR) repeat protein